MNFYSDGLPHRFRGGDDPARVNSARTANATASEVSAIKRHLARTIGPYAEDAAVSPWQLGLIYRSAATDPYTDARYKVQINLPANALYSDELLTLEADETYLATNSRIVTATNLAETRKFDAQETGSHLLFYGHPVLLFAATVPKPIPATHYFFHSPPRRHFTALLTAIGSGRGKYTVTLLGRRTSGASDVNTTSNVTLADVGTTVTADGAVSGAIACNLREIDITTALPTVTGNLLSLSRIPLHFPAWLHHVNSNGTPVVHIDAIQNRVCT